MPQMMPMNWTMLMMMTILMFLMLKMNIYTFFAPNPSFPNKIKHFTMFNINW